MSQHISRLILLSVCFTQTAVAQPGRSRLPLPKSVQLTANIPYADTENSRQQLDLLLPTERERKKLPVIVFVHGGAWRGGDRRAGHRRLADYVASGQYAGVSVGYRLTDQAHWPAQIHDCKAAIRWIRAHAQEYQLDADHIGVSGSSAGGHLVAMLGVSGNTDKLDGTLGSHRQQSSSVACVIDEYGPSDLLAMKDYPSRMNHDEPASPEGRLVGGRVSDHPQTARSASPVTWVSAESPPFLIVHGDKDPLVPFNQSERLQSALKQAGGEVSLITVQEGGHGGFRNPDIARRQRAFFDRHLRGISAAFEDVSLPSQPQ
ncbi:MAG: alpha/beta hydrolase [Planctomycetaceae bacterium]|nr:alpha/beta hydrolase [Planctomycetaceae bacterium]